VKRGVDNRVVDASVRHVEFLGVSARQPTTGSSSRVGGMVTVGDSKRLAL